MSSHHSSSDLLVLQAVRTLGYTNTVRVAARTQLNTHEVEQHLLDAQAQGHITWTSFSGDAGWSVTEAGKAHGEGLLAAELDATGARAAVAAVYDDFLPINDLVGGACTRWQLTELGIGDEPTTLGKTIDALLRAADALKAFEARLTARLERFRGYHTRFATACHRAEDDPTWITGTDLDSAHKVWFELHEDLIATLGLTR